MPLTPVTREAMRALVLDFLGTNANDKFYTTTKLDRHINIAYSKLTQEIQLLSPSWSTKIVTLTADAPDGRTYSASLQVPQLTDFSRALRVRKTNDSGEILSEVSDETLEDGSGACYSIIGEDEWMVLQTSKGVTAGIPLWMKYEFNPTFGALDSDTPEAIPASHHHVIALDAAQLLFALGGESTLPKELAEWRLDDKANLFLKVGRRSTTTVTTRREE